MKRLACLCTVVVLVAALFPRETLAEVSTETHQNVASTIILGLITEGPDPIGQVSWEPVRGVPAAQILNPDGDSRGDGRPDIAWKSNSWPVVAWAYNLGSDHDIALSEWSGSSWTAAEFLTSGIDDELDPRVTVEPDGTVHVAWWVAGVDQVYVATRPSGASLWNAPVLVTAGPDEGRRPSVTVDASGTLRVAYERSSSATGMAQDVVVATHVGGGAFQSELVASTTRTDALEIVVHAEAGELWLDWLHGDNEFGCIRDEASGWSSVIVEPWPGLNWIGIEETRRGIRRQVLGY